MLYPIRSLFYLNVRSVYHVSLAVFYITMDWMGESLYGPKADFKQRPRRERNRDWEEKKQLSKWMTKQRKFYKRCRNILPVIQHWVSFWQRGVNSHFFSKAITLYNCYYVRKIKPQTACVWVWRLSWNHCDREAASLKMMANFFLALMEKIV